jgi:hypothetical protein
VRRSVIPISSEVVPPLRLAPHLYDTGLYRESENRPGWRFCDQLANSANSLDRSAMCCFRFDKSSVDLKALNLRLISPGNGERRPHLITKDRVRGTIEQLFELPCSPTHVSSRQPLLKAFGTRGRREKKRVSQLLKRRRATSQAANASSNIRLSPINSSSRSSLATLGKAFDSRSLDAAAEAEAADAEVPMSSCRRVTVGKGTAFTGTRMFGTVNAHRI